MIYGLTTYNHIGDSAIATGAVHNVKIAHPELEFTFNGCAKELWMHNPDVCKDKSPDELIHIRYGSLDKERVAGRGNVVEGVTMTLCEKLGIDYVPIVTRTPYIPLTNDEKERSKEWNDCWLLNANYQTCSISKGYPYWQEVVYLLPGKKIMQVGSYDKRTMTNALHGVIDYRGKTDNIRDYLTLIYGCRGIISPPSGIVNIGAGFGKTRMVVVCGGRELPELTGYDCAYITSDRCEFSKDRPCMSHKPLGSGKRVFWCGSVIDGYSECMRKILPRDIANAVLLLDFSK